MVEGCVSAWRGRGPRALRTGRGKLQLGARSPHPTRPAGPGSALRRSQHVPSTSGKQSRGSGNAGAAAAGHRKAPGLCGHTAQHVRQSPVSRPGSDSRGHQGGREQAWGAAAVPGQARPDRGTRRLPPPACEFNGSSSCWRALLQCVLNSQRDCVVSPTTSAADCGVQARLQLVRDLQAGTARTCCTAAGARSRRRRPSHCYSDNLSQRLGGTHGA